MTSLAIAQTEIEITGVQEFLGKKIPVIEGGFGESEKVVLAKTIAEIHEVDLKRINELINENIDEFEEGIDILDLHIIRARIFYISKFNENRKSKRT